MADTKLWCWELAERGSGPDWLLTAEFDRASETILAQIATAPPGYAACDEAEADCAPHHGRCAIRSFIDASNADDYLANLSGGAARNIWVYNLIQIHRDLLTIACGYGGRGDDYNRAETALLLHLLADPGIALRSWQVLAGGDGYDFQSVAAGADTASLSAYLARMDL